MATRAKSLRYALAALVAGTCLFGLPAASSAEDQQPGRYPGLPYVPCDPNDLPIDPCYGLPEFANSYGWLNFPQVGLTGSVKAMQWARVPLTMVAASVVTSYTESDTGVNDPPQEFFYYVRGFFTSPEGSPDNYGDSALVPVRTVVFGSIPVEATLQVSQRRDANDLPLPLELRPYDTKDVGADDVTFTVYPTVLEDVVDVRVRELRIDNVALELAQECGTGPTARIAVSSKELKVNSARDYTPADGSPTKLEEMFDPTVDHYGIYGGTLAGTIDIPEFLGCTTADGDDISSILTAAISGNGNPLSVRVGATQCTILADDLSYLPNPPGVNSPDEANCREGVAKNPDIVARPKPFDIPNYAPVAQP